MRRYRKTLEAIASGIDVVTAGFPCQDESVAGLKQRLQFDESTETAITRTGLFGAVIRTLRLVRPLYVILENVAGLLNGSMGVVVGKLAESGYDCEWDCIPSGLDFGHERERVFFLAHANGIRLQGGVVGMQEDQEQRNIYAAILPTFSFRKADPKNDLPPPYIVGTNDGLPNRAHRIKALGNSIVPDIAKRIGQAIMQYEKSLC
jgi:DNA (cytosine-5)-methyltransferase 1